MSRKKPELPGHDPLEWLKEESTTPHPTPASPGDTSQPQLVSSEAAATADNVQGPAIEKTAAPDTPPLLNLASSLQVMDVALLKPKMEACLRQLKKITLRADKQIVVDGAGVQLLLAFVQQARADDIELHWEDLPPPIIEAARLLNAQEVLLNN